MQVKARAAICFQTPEQARIVQLLVERVDVRMHGVEVRLRPNGLTGLVREVVGNGRAAA